MAFIPQTSFVPRHTSLVPSRTACPRVRIFATATDPIPNVSLPVPGPAPTNDTPFELPDEFKGPTVRSADAMEFFKHREGRWESWRVTHHLAFKRAESGESTISMKVLPKDDERIVALCKDHKVDPDLAQGGCYVTWMATMAWDQEGENHEGSTVFALVPDEGDMRRGRILRDRGYAEIVPIAGTYFLDDQDDLNLETPYDGGEVVEKFSFDGMDIVNRISTVRRFGGYSTATFATESRYKEGQEEDLEDDGIDVVELIKDMMLFGPPREEDKQQEAQVGSLGRNRWGTSSTAPPSANSAFGSGFSSGTQAPLPANSAFANKGTETGENTKEEKTGGLSEAVLEAAKKEGIDLSKIPPSMRDDFVASFENQNGK